MSSLIVTCVGSCACLHLCSGLSHWRLLIFPFLTQPPLTLCSILVSVFHHSHLQVIHAYHCFHFIFRTPCGHSESYFPYFAERRNWIFSKINHLTFLYHCDIPVSRLGASLCIFKSHDHLTLSLQFLLSRAQEL